MSDVMMNPGQPATSACVAVVVAMMLGTLAKALVANAALASNWILVVVSVVLFASAGYRGMERTLGRI